MVREYYRRRKRPPYFANYLSGNVGHDDRADHLSGEHGSDLDGPATHGSSQTTNHTSQHQHYHHHHAGGASSSSSEDRGGASGSGGGVRPSSSFRNLVRLSSSPAPAVAAAASTADPSHDPNLALWRAVSSSKVPSAAAAADAPPSAKMLDTSLREHDDDVDDVDDDDGPSSSAAAATTKTWRLRERVKTSGVCLVLALNIGTDPPDMDRPVRCARLQCWLDPTSMSRAKARERIGERLEAQYARWQQRSRLRYRRATDPTVEEVRELCRSMRGTNNSSNSSNNSNNSNGSNNGSGSGRGSVRTGERLLLHYNGHGVPRPTANGEIWLFDKDHTQYIPLSVTSLKQWIGRPSILVFDCSNAGVLMPFLVGDQMMAASGNGGTNVGYGAPNHVGSINNNNNNLSASAVDVAAASAVHGIIVMCPCSEGELLPMNPEFPADIFTSCLTTPIPIALKWFLHCNSDLHQPGAHYASSSSAPHSAAASSSSVNGATGPGLSFAHANGADPGDHGAASSPFSPDALNDPDGGVSRLVPGNLADRRTPLGELNWIFTAVTDTIAWNVLPSALFQRLFRQDLLVASMFRNFLLADRVLRSCRCTPRSWPPIPDSASTHPLWQAWDLAVETCLTRRRWGGAITANGEESASASAPVPRAPTPSVTTAASIVSGHAGGGTPVATPPPSSATASSAEHHGTSPFFAEQLTSFEIWLEYARDASSKRVRLAPPEGLPVVLQVLLSQAHRSRALDLLERFLKSGPWAVDLALSVGIFPYVLKLLKSHVDDYKHVLVGIWARILAFDESCRVDLVKDKALEHFVTLLRWRPPPRDEDGNDVARRARGAAAQRATAAFVLTVVCRDHPAGRAECARRDVGGAIDGPLSRLGDRGGGTDGGDDEDPDVPARSRAWLCLCLGTLWEDHEAARADARANGSAARARTRLARDDDPDARAAAAYALGRLIGEPEPEETDDGTTTTTNASSPRLASSPVGFLGPPTTTSFLPDGGPVIPPHTMMNRSASTNGGGGGGGLPWRSPTLLHGPTMTPAQQPHVVRYRGAPVGPGMVQVGPNVVGTGHPTPLGVVPAGPSVVLPSGVVAYPPHSHQPLLRPQQPLPPQPLLPPQLRPPQLRPLHVLPASHNDPPPSIDDPAPSSSRPRDVFSDADRVAADLDAGRALADAAAEDASPVVRLECVVGLGRLVGRYLPAFVAAAVDDDAAAPFPASLDPAAVRAVRDLWAALRTSRRRDPHPAPGGAANDVVSLVHARALRVRRREDEEETTATPPSPTPPSLDRARSFHLLNAADADDAVDPDDPARRRAAVPTPPSPFARAKSETLFAVVPDDDGPRVAAAPSGDARYAVRYALPVSRLLAWRIRGFADDERRRRSDDDALPPDPLDPVDASRARRARRDAHHSDRARALERHFACLAPGRRTATTTRDPARRRPSYDPAPDVDDDDDGGRAAAREAELSDRKRALQLRQCSTLPGDGPTAGLLFHPREPALVAHDRGDRISLWDVGRPTDSVADRVVVFRNRSPSDPPGRPVPVRVTSTAWINEETGPSLLLVADEEGAVRVWDGLLERDGRPSSSDGERPVLATAFRADPDLVAVGAAGRRGGDSGLVAEWQPFRGRLVVGGEGPRIRFWDVEAERCVHSVDRRNDACVTTLTTAWDPFRRSDDDDAGRGLPATAGGYSGVGPNVVIAGYGNGAMKVFDCRSTHAGPAIEHNNNDHQGRHKRRGLMEYAEHDYWIVDTLFTGYGGRYEVVSGCVGGEIKIWDLRYPSDVRVLGVQRSPMTAFAGHPRVPLLATGSHAQFIKMVTLDGDTLSIVRCHESTGQRIGPVSCLSFHPHRVLLAAGTTDDVVTLYGPNL